MKNPILLVVAFMAILIAIGAWSAMKSVEDVEKAIEKHNIQIEGMFLDNGQPALITGKIVIK